MRPGKDFKGMVSTGDNLFKDQDLTTVDPEDSLVLTAQGEMAETTAVAIDHDHKIRERGILRVFQDVSDVDVVLAIKLKQIVKTSRNFWRG